MTRLAKYVVVLLFGVLFQACSDDNSPLPRPKLVVEGWIDSNGQPIVLLSSTAVPTNDGGNIEDLIARWGKVTITDGDNEYAMIGGPQQSVGFPFYRYYSNEMRGVPGQTYTICAEYGGETVRATSTMPSAQVQIDTIRYADGATTVSFYAPEQCPANVIVLVRTPLRERYYLSPLAMTVCHTPGEYITMPVLRPRALAEDEYTEHFHPGEDVYVALAVVSDESYAFWKVYDGVASFGSSSFLGSLSSLPSNIEGGYGLWSARSLSRAVKIEF